MEDSLVSPENAIFTPFGTSTSIFLTHHYNEVSLLSTHLTRMTLWLSPSLLQTSWCPRSLLTRAAPQISYIGELPIEQNTSSVQGSINIRFTLGEPFLLLSSISIGTQGTQGLPLMIFSIPNFLSVQEYKYIKNPRSALESKKTQGLPLVRMPTKPKAPPRSTHS